MVMINASPYTQPAIHAQRLPTRRRDHGYSPPEIGNCETDFTEHQADEQLADSDEQVPPEHRRTASGEREG